MYRYQKPIIFSFQPEHFQAGSTFGLTCIIRGFPSLSEPV